jgi:transcriptional regulator with XRE-family HTH domain
MKKRHKIVTPVMGVLKKIGEDIRDARRRRNITMALLAERAGINVLTMSKIEKGNAGVSMGGYASVLYSLGMIERLQEIADGRHDLMGQMLVEERLPQRVRMRKG